MTYILLERADFETAGRWYETRRFTNKREAVRELRGYRKRWTGLYQYLLVVDLDL